MTIAEKYVPSQTREEQQILVLFTLGRQIYALPVEVVAQIIPMVTILQMPQADAAVRGLINVRGMLIPVVSVSHLLGLPEIELRLHTPILLVKYSNLTLGIIVEDVVDVLAVTSREVESSVDILPQTLKNNGALVGLINSAKGTVFLLDIVRMFEGRENQTVLEVIKTVATSNGIKREDAAPAITSPEASQETETSTAVPMASSPRKKTAVKNRKKGRMAEPQDQESPSAEAGKGNSAETDVQRKP